MKEGERGGPERREGDKGGERVRGGERELSAFMHLLPCAMIVVVTGGPDLSPSE